MKKSLSLSTVLKVAVVLVVAGYSWSTLTAAVGGAVERVIVSKYNTPYIFPSFD